MRLISECLAQVNKEFYLFSAHYNILYKVDTEHDDVHLVSSVPGEHLDRNRLSTSMNYLDGKLYIIPMKGKGIWIYEVESGKWECINTTSSKEEISGLMQSVVFNDNIFAFGGLYPGIIKLNTKNNEVEIIDAPFSNIKKGKCKDVFFRTSYAVKDSEMYLASCISNDILKFDLVSGRWEWIKIEQTEQRFSGITYDGHNFWISPRKEGCVIKWDGNNVVDKYEITKEVDGEAIRPIGIYYYNNEIILPGYAHKYAQNKIPAKTIKIIDDKIEILEEEYLFYKCKSEESIFIRSNGSIGVVTNKSNKKIYNNEIEKEHFKDYILHVIEEKKVKLGFSGIQSERDQFDLMVFNALLRGKDTKG